MLEKIVKEPISLLRINLSHTDISDLEKIISKIQEKTSIPICLDSEGAQIRNQSVHGGKIRFKQNDIVKIHFEPIEGDSNNLSFYPKFIAQKFEIGDSIHIDFNSVVIRVTEKRKTCCMAVVDSSGIVGSNKATNLERSIQLDSITEKDKLAINIGKRMGIRHFALSFASSKEDVQQMREMAGKDSIIISKIESRKGLINLEDILKYTDEILIDRGDLSREISLKKIPFLQRRIISTARSQGVPVFVATNLLESMVTTKYPTRAELNDVVSTLLMGANGLVLAAETAVGEYPLEAIIMIKELILQREKWTPNTSIQELLS